MIKKSSSKIVTIIESNVERKISPASSIRASRRNNAASIKIMMDATISNG
jgi:hypothetical protein